MCCASCSTVRQRAYRDRLALSDRCYFGPNLRGNCMRSPSSRSIVNAAVSHVRYKVLAFGVCLAAITYLDRVCISITAPEMMRELSLSPLQMSFVFSAFTFAYGLFEIPTGWWGDRVGTRR